MLKILEIKSLAVAIMLFAGCSSTASTGTETKPAETTKSAESAPAAQTGVKLGLHHVVDISKSVDAKADKNGQAQVNTVMAVVTVDGSGKILAVKIDNAQVKDDFDATGKLKTV